MSPQTYDHTPIETFKYGITRTYIDEGRIAIIKTEGNMLKNAIDTWASLLILTMQEWDAPQPIAVLHDLSHPAQGLTPYARERAADLMNYRPEGAMIYSAVVLPPTFMNKIIGQFIRLSAFQHPNHQARIFVLQDDAIVWLRQQSAAHQA